MTIRYEFCDVWPNDGMWDHLTGRVRRDAEGGVWFLDDHHGPTDEEVMRPIIDAAMREDNER